MKACGNIHSNFTIQIQSYYTGHYNIVQEFLHDFDGTKYEFTS